MAQTIEKVIARIFSMSDEVWERHANPLSVWTRYSVLPTLMTSTRHMIARGQLMGKDKR